ncbi:MAG TPA: tripartite tricarboxylate transporter substrate binding protein, partial [Chloroflexota bacterium]|nr:tripartite tricarboxylate transporter substrate binding protein [Chloroflexota bacterium]
VGMTNLPSSITPYLDPSRGAAYGRKDLLPVANHVWDPETVGVAANSPYKTLKDLVDAAKAKPGEIKAAITGLQSDNHLALLLFQKEAGIKFSVVTMEGTAQANPALLGGHVDVLFQSSGGFAPLVQSGQARLLGMMDKQESKFYPGVKTFEAQGYKVNYASSRGISVPTGTPKEIVNILTNATKRAMESEEMKKKMDEGFFLQRYMSPEEYATYWDQFEAQTKELMALAK